VSGTHGFLNVSYHFTSNIITMNYRLNSNMIIAVAVLVAIAIGLFVYTLVGTPAGDRGAEESTTTPPVALLDTIIAGKHQYVDGIHTVAGMLSVPTPCHSVVIEPFFVDGTATTTVELRFTTVREGADCPDVVSDAPYRVVFEGPENTQITALFNGKPARLNLVPVAPGESLGEEFYFKG
jgi:hypothetical protein